MISHINILLFGMILLYLLAIICVYDYSINNNYSISDVLKKCNYDVIIIMFLMGLLTIIYEYYLINNKKTLSSFITIIFLLFGLYGLLLIDNNYLIHYVFAFIVFISILLYMIFNCHIYNCYKLKILLILELVISIFMLYNFDKEIFYQEVLLLIIFAIYFFIVHIKNIN